MKPQALEKVAAIEKKWDVVIQSRVSEEKLGWIL
jgi:hypothetical protein